MCQYRAWVYSLVCMLSSAMGQSHIYHSVDAHGIMTFSDIPQTGSQPYDLNSANVSDFNGASVAPDGQAVATALGGVAAASAATYTVSIVQPLDQTTVHNQSPITVIASVQPSLKAGDSAQLMIDGLPTGAPQTALQFTVQDLIRGTHQIQVRILDANGQTLKVSLAITLFKQQATVLLPTTPPPGKGGSS